MCGDSHNNNSELYLHDYNNRALQKCQKHDNYSNLVIRVQHWHFKIKKRKKEKKAIFITFIQYSRKGQIHFETEWG